MKRTNVLECEDDSDDDLDLVFGCGIFSCSINAIWLRFVLVLQNVYVFRRSAAAAVGGCSRFHKWPGGGAAALMTHSTRWKRVSPSESQPATSKKKNPL